jgi:hypothetical protein
MTYPFAGEIKMNKVIKDGQEMIEWEKVDMSLHSAGNLGIGTQPTGNICFFGTHADNPTEVLRLSKDGIWANPDIAVDEAAKLVLAAINFNIKVLVDKAVADEREACAKVCDWYVDYSSNPMNFAENCAQEIRARSNT